MNYYNQETHPDQKFFLSERSEDLLSEVQANLAEVVKRAVAISDLEIQVNHGKRTLEQQDEFFKKGVAPGANSPHLYGYAVDLIAYVGDRACFELEVYDEVANCMRYAGLDLNTPIRWGGAWQCENICTYDGMIEDLQAWYLDHCFQQNMRPQLDIQHFELSLAG